ncbi:glycosyltransferase family 4 protein [Yonghaparkia sp. Root332]|uniref:glycosyltransferase family 4 protein n=1 Tax=Yonghaparkia sp. Root332 TaxID=1736516 RepID=UPI0006F747D4|nr:glycosyltransferase family 4 protein [Yonghaparkia sp. Root332]KQV25456.1 hypothetical protein ASC54_00120 [Yonghaparkia sp. Root332]
MAIQKHVVLAVTSELTARTFYSEYPGYLVQRGWRVTLMSQDEGGLAALARGLGADAAPIPIARNPSPARDLVALVSVWRTLRRLRPDVVVAATPKAGLLVSVAARLARVPNRVYQVWGLRLETSTGWRRTLMGVAERIAAASSTRVVAVSPSLADRVRELGIARDVTVLGSGSSHGVDLDRFTRTEPRARGGAFTVGFVGRLTADKGIATLAEAALKVAEFDPTIEFVLVGPAEDTASEAAVRRAADAGASIRRLPYTADTRDVYEQFSLVCLPTLREGFPNVVLEAGAMGLPTITTTATGAVDSVVQGVTGLLVPPGDPSALADAICRLASDPALCEVMGANARARVESEYSQRRVFELQEAFLASLSLSASDH